MTLIKFKDFDQEMRREFTCAFLDHLDLTSDIYGAYCAENFGSLIWAQPWHWCPDHAVPADVQSAAVLFFGVCLEIVFHASSVRELKQLYLRYYDVA